MLERADQTKAELDEQHAELGALWREAIAACAADTLHQLFGAQLGEVVAQLAEAVVTLVIPTLAKLFGSMDLCECEHCRSRVRSSVWTASQALDPHGGKSGC